MTNITELYDDMLNECYGLVTIGGLEYDHARAQEEIDPIAYREGYLDYQNSLEEDGWEFDDDGDVISQGD